MISLDRAQITIAHSATAIGVSDKQLRNWLDRGLVTLEGADERDKGEWRRLSIRDVIRFSIVARIAAYGLKIEEANELVIEMVDDWIDTAARSRREPSVVVEYLKTKVLFVTHGGSRGICDVKHNKFPDLSEFDERADFAAFRLGAIAEAALKRLYGDEDESD
jgi:broad specificity phosphatase PhoE